VILKSSKVEEVVSRPKGQNKKTSPWGLCYNRNKKYAKSFSYNPIFNGGGALRTIEGVKKKRSRKGGYTATREEDAELQNGHQFYKHWSV